MKQGYQPIHKSASVIPPNAGSHVRMKENGYTWKDLDKAWWEGFDNAKNKMKKRIAELEKENAELKNRNAELKGMYAYSAREAGTYKQFLELKEKQLAKAREILRLFLDADNLEMINAQRNAEQFLKEIENDR